MDEKKHLMDGLKKFLKGLNRDFSIDKIILFGSRAIDNFSEESDVDLIIVSPNFEGKDFFDRVKKMYDYWELDLPVDFLCYTPKEFNKLKKQISIISGALKEGIVIK